MASILNSIKDINIRELPMKKLILLPALLLASSATFAQNYQFEIGAEYESNDTASAGGLLAQLFFTEVDTQDKPLREADFLGRKGNVYASIIQEDYKYGDSEDAHRIGTEAYIPKAYLFVGLEYRSINDGYWGATLGFTPAKGLRITTEYWDELDYEANIQVKYVAGLTGQQSINVELGYYTADGDAEDTTTLEIDYYINHSLSLGVGLTDQVDTDYVIDAEWFFTDRYSTRASYNFGEYDDTWGIGLSYRY